MIQSRYLINVSLVKYISIIYGYFTQLVNFNVPNISDRLNNSKRELTL